MIQFYKWDSGLWFRVFGFGLCIQNNAKNPQLFSMRCGKIKSWFILGYRLHLLKSSKTFERVNDK